MFTKINCEKEREEGRVVDNSPDIEQLDLSCLISKPLEQHCFRLLLAFLTELDKTARQSSNPDNFLFEDLISVSVDGVIII